MLSVYCAELWHVRDGCRTILWDVLSTCCLSGALYGWVGTEEGWELQVRVTCLLSQGKIRCGQESNTQNPACLSDPTPPRFLLSPPHHSLSASSNPSSPTKSKVIRSSHLWGGFFDAPAWGLPPQGPGACMPSLQRGPLVSAPSCSGPGICPSSWKTSIWRADAHWGRACSETLSAVWTPAWKRCVWGNSCYCVSKSGLGSILTFHSKQDFLTPHSSA